MHCKEPDRQETILYGENGGMRISNEIEVYSESNGIQTNSQLLGAGNTKVGSVTEHFCRVVRKQDEPIITGEQALLGLRIIKAIYESAKSRKTVYFQ